MDSAETSSNASLNPTKCTIYVVFFPLPFSCIYLNWQNWHLGRFAFTIADQLYVLCCMPDCLQSMASLFTYICIYRIKQSNQIIFRLLFCKCIIFFVGEKTTFIIHRCCLEATPPKPLPHTHVVYANACKRSRKLNGLLYYIRVVCRHVCMYQT